MMTTSEPDDLEQQLADLTRWHGGPPRLWRKALRTAGRPERPGRLRRWVAARPLPTALAACLVVAALGTTTWLLSHQMPQTTCQANISGIGTGVAAYSGRAGGLSMLNGFPPPDNDFGVSYGYHVPYAPHSTTASGGDSRTEGWNVNPNPQQAEADRKVIRRVTLQLSTPDVRATYLRAALLISQARGEFVQDSALTGTGNQMQANLTLRVAVDRLSEVLNELRELGKVESEQANGEDVTEQVVDVEARLANEQRVEKELQELLENRQDAPLEDIIKLRDKLSEVRGSIERLIAQRDQLDRLVKLATVLVIIRPAEAGPPPSPSIKDYFAGSISSAWTRSLQFLADTVAFCMSVLVGGIIWWVLLIVLVVVAVRCRRRHEAQ